MLYLLLTRDCIEIILFSCFIYAFSTWLKTDKNNNLLPYFFCYCILSIAAWMTNLQTITSFLFTYAPIALLIFIVIHERTLQRNFVTLCNPQPYKEKEQHDWLDIILRSTLSSINNNKAVTIIIEHNDSLSSFLISPFFINATLTKELLDIILASTDYDQQKMIWISTNGIIRSINTTWVSTKHHNTPDAFIYSTHTDMIVFHTTPLTRTSTLILDGKEFSSLSAHNLRTLIKKQITPTVCKKDGKVYRERNQSEKSPFF